MSRPPAYAPTTPTGAGLAVDRVLELVERDQVTMLPGPYHALLEAAGSHDLSSLQAAVPGPPIFRSGETMSLPI